MDTATSKQKNKVLHTYTTMDDHVYVKYETPEGNIEEKFLEVPWYFAIKKTDIEKAGEILNRGDFVFKVIDDPKFPEYFKIYTHQKKIVLALEKIGVETYEGDLMEDKRWFVDKEVEVASNYRKLYFDIETDDTNEKIEIGRDRILSYAAIDSTGKKFFKKISELSDEAEIKLLENFAKLIEKYDIILGWNSSGFDIPYIKARMKKYKVRCKWKLVGKFDLLKRFRHIFRFDSHIRTFSLEFISQHFLGKGKVERPEKVIELWQNNEEKLKLYNIEDSILVKELDEKLGVSTMMIRQSQWCGVPATQFGLYAIIDSHIMRTAHRVGQFCRTSVKAIEERDKYNERGNDDPSDTKSFKKEEDTGAKYSGAIVLDPKIGVYRGVHVFDFKGLYPSMMRTSNIGYDTLRYDSVGGDMIINPGTMNMNRKAGGIKKTFFLKKPSVINLAISELIAKRSEYKKLKLKMIEEGTNKGPEWEKVVSDEIIVKELSNSTYGIMGLEYGRYFSVDVAESITLFGQWCILFAKHFFEGEGYTVVYGDTDSVFVHTGEKPFDIEESRERFHTALKKELHEKYNIDEVFIELEFDKKHETLILIEKKTYVGHVTNIERKKTNDIYARGLEYHKKNTFSYAAKKQKELIEMILYKHPKGDEINSWLWKTREEFFNSDFTKDDLLITQKVGRDLESYTGKTPPAHVRLAKQIFEKTGNFYKNMEVEYIIVDNTRKYAILADEYDGKFDRNYYWENKTRPLLERVANVVCPGYEWFNPTMSLFG